MDSPADWRQVVPSPGLPAGLEVRRANNNLDAVAHGDRLYLAFRTAPTHFASAAALVHVVASSDAGLTWAHETTLRRGRDLREPRLVVWRDRLLLYCFEAGTHPLRFEPGRVLASERRANGAWTPLRPVAQEGLVVWRVRVLDGRLVMSAYAGGDKMYTRHPEPTTVRLLESDDGFAWKTLAEVLPGGTETEVVSPGNGTWYLVSRCEAEPWGSLVGTCPAGRPEEVETRTDPRKFDSPFLFEAGGTLWLLARRQCAFGGRYRVGLDRLSRVWRTRVYQVLYSATPKRTALWRLDPDTLGVTHVADLASRGDTAFAAVAAGQVFNYSTPLGGGDLPWLAGQVCETRIYAAPLSLPTT